ncbi:MAG: hypothetical protein MK106_11385 [Mariniblastus sp.]|nr:hypothetical protein [Mariniblastus sp.]
MRETTTREVISSRTCQLVIAASLSSFILLVAGCGGCAEEDPQTASQSETDKEKGKENYDHKPPVVFPGNYKDEIRTNRTKLGHWVTADVRVIANNFNAQGELIAQPYNGRLDRPSRVPRTNYFERTIRPASLPQGEWRNLEMSFYLPKNKSLKNTTVDFEFRKDANSFGAYAMRFTRMTMQSFQQHMVILTNRPDAYLFVESLDSVVIPEVTPAGERYPPFYYVVRTRPSESPVPLPREALNWTTIAYLVWDDFEADQLDREQQRALMDWLHFGGQLILSGPDCLDKLQSSFLAEYLPAKFKGTRNLTEKDLSELNQHWAVPVKNKPAMKHVLKLDADSPLIGVEFDPHPKAAFVNQTGQMAIERSVGRGRIVMTAFSIDESPVVAWPSYPSFFNGCLLRRPARRFIKNKYDGVSYVFSGYASPILDPMLASTLRYTSRDLSIGGTPQKISTGSLESGGDLGAIGPSTVVSNVPVSSEAGLSGGSPSGAVGSRQLDDHWHYGGYQHDDQTGTAGWNDNSGISNAARKTLKEAAGITPPSSRFVLQMLAVYLIVLVPLNWGVFKLLGRVEWAWIAAPIIAIAGAVIVAKMAALDIGFVRSNSQVALLEVYGEHDRGHLAQYSALYTSLSTGYDLTMDNISAQSLPFGGPQSTLFQPAESMLPVELRTTVTNRLENFQIKSNTTGMLHTEMMLGLGGVFQFDDRGEVVKLKNETDIGLQSTAILRRLGDGSLEIAWIGELKPKSQQEGFSFQRVAPAAEADGVRQIWLDRDDSFSNAEYGARKIWEGLSGADEVDSRPLTDFRGVPEIETQWSAFLQIIRRVTGADVGLKEIQAQSISYLEFSTAYSQLKPSAQINVSRLFDAMIENLEIAPGETRLLGVTRQSLGSNRFEPLSTQTDQETLVLVHLKRPPLPMARRDLNLMSDMSGGRTSLDWQNEVEELDDLLRDRGQHP